jgi:ribose transport system substrate-binding protein
MKIGGKSMMGKLKKARHITFVLAIVISLTGCTTTKTVSISDSNNADKKEFTVAFSVKTLTNESFQQAIADSIKAKVESYGDKFIIVTAGGQTAVASQVNQIEDLISKKVDAIIINPIDSNAVIPVMKKAKEKGIKVVLVDTPIDKSKEDLYLTYVGTDNFNAGQLAGKKMAELLNNKGKVLIVRGANGNAAGDGRVNGFKKGLEGSGVEVAAEQAGDWSNDKAMQVTENMLQGHKDVDAIFSASDVMLDGILQGLNESKKTNVKIISVDGSKKGVDMIQNHQITGTMAQFPAKIGDMAADTVLQVLHGKLEINEVKKTIDSGTNLYDQSNLTDALITAF